MLTTLKVSSLACKCVFYRPEQNAMERLHGTEFFKVLKCKNEIYQRIELIKIKMRSFPELWSLKCQKWLIFLYFLLVPAKDQSQFRENIYLHLKNLI